jgi:hypothetical protein
VVRITAYHPKTGGPLPKSTQSICLLIGFALSSCANALQVSYICDPPGAELYEEYTQIPRKLGTCPVTVTYDVTEAQKQQGYILLRSVTAKWVSGASRSLPSIKADLQNGYSKDVEITRPQDVPGYENDARYGRDLERTQMLEEQQQRSNNNVWR